MQNQANINKQLTLEKLARSVDILCSEVESILKSKNTFVVGQKFEP